MVVELEDGTLDEVYSTNVYVPKTTLLLKEIQTLLSCQGLRNVQHSDPQVPLEKYMEKFNEFVKRVLEDLMREVRQLSTMAANRALARDNIPDPGLPIANWMKDQMKQAWRDLDREGRDAVERILAWNKPPLVFAMDEQFLHQVYKADERREAQEMLDVLNRVESVRGNNALTKVKEFLQKAAQPSSEESVLHNASEEVLSKIQAYVKVQVKAVTEAGCKEAGRIFLVEGVKRFAEHSARASIDLIRESSERKQMRELLTNRVKALQKALEALEDV